jgi:hypothetical protein
VGNNSVSCIDVNGRWTWNSTSADSKLRAVIEEWRNKGWNFPADALDWFRRGNANNLDLSQYHDRISSNRGWQIAFINSIEKQIKKKDPSGSGKMVEIGDVEHKSNFDANLSNASFSSTTFRAIFNFRFHYMNSQELFYALYGSRYSYYGKGALCRRSDHWSFASYRSATEVEFDVKIASWDQLTYPSGFLWLRRTFPSYSAAHFIEESRKEGAISRSGRYRAPFIYLRWREKGHWIHTTYGNSDGLITEGISSL